MVSRFFIVYEHRLFAEIMLTVLGSTTVVGAKSRPNFALSELVAAITEAHPNVVILESAANGNTAWHLLLSGGQVQRVVVLDIERGLIREYGIDTSKIESLTELQEYLVTSSNQRHLE